MKKHLSSWLALGAGLLLAATSARAQAITWQTALDLPAPGSGTSVVRATAPDASGNVYLAGTFTGTIYLGATTFIDRSGSGAFVAKWNPAGGFVWARQISADPLLLAVRGNSVYVAGQFAASASFGATTLTSGGNMEVFVAKLTDAGNTSSWAWALAAGGREEEIPTGLTVAGSNVYVAGWSRSPTFSCGADVFTNTHSPNYPDGFVAKVRDAGSAATWVWATTASGSGHDFINALVVNGSNVYVAGSFESDTLNLGAISLPKAFVRGYSDGFVAKLTDGGSTATWTWALATGNNLDEEIDALAVNGNALYLTGLFAGTTFQLGATTLTSSGGGGGFLAKLTDSGTTGAWTWALPLGCFSNSLAVRGNDVYVAGQFISPATFGPVTVTSPGLRAGVVAQLTDTGTTGTWTTALAFGSSDDYPQVVTADHNRVYVGGAFASRTLTFGNTTLTRRGSGSGNGFLAILGAPVLGAEDGAPVPAFSLTPNPATGIVRLTGAPAGPVQLLDAVGRVVRAFEPRAADFELPLEGLPPGLYTVRVGAVARRLVVE